MTFIHNGETRLLAISLGRTLSFFSLREHDFLDSIITLDYAKILSDILSDKTTANVELQPLNISVSSGKQPDMTISPPSARDKQEINISVKQILDKGFFTSEFKSVAQIMSSRAYTQWQQAVSYINKRDAFIETVEVI